MEAGLCMEVGPLLEEVLPNEPEAIVMSFSSPYDAARHNEKEIHLAVGTSVHTQFL